MGSYPGSEILILPFKKNRLGCPTTTDLVIRRQAWIMEGSLHQLHQQVLERSLALGKPQQPFLQGGEAGDVLGYVEADRLSVSLQELHHSQTVRKSCARKNHAGDAGQFWEGLVATTIKH